MWAGLQPLVVEGPPERFLRLLLARTCVYLPRLGVLFRLLPRVSDPATVAGGLQTRQNVGERGEIR